MSTGDRPRAVAGRRSPVAGRRDSRTGLARDVVTSTGPLLRIAALGDPRGRLVVELEGHMAQLVATPASYVARLVEGGLRVVRVDNRDVGGSQRFPGSAYSLREMADDIHGLITVLDGPAVVCGRSMGGAVAQLLALAHPEAVDGLGLFYTFAKESPAPPTVSEQPPPFHDEPGFVRWQLDTVPWIAGSAFPYPPGFLDELARRAWARGVDWSGFERQRLAMAATEPWADRLPLLDPRLPVAIVHGAEDPIVPVRAAYRLHELVPHSSLQVVPGLGHQQPPELDDLFVAATRHAAGC